MAHHAYLYSGSLEEGITEALAYGERELGLPSIGNPDVVVLRYGLFSVADARRVITLANQASVTGDKKLLVIAASRLFHEAQNALLKLLEEPAEGTTIVLVVPTVGIVLSTILSRTLPLPRTNTVEHPNPADDFISSTPEVREKLVAKLLDQTKADKDEDKQRARGELRELAEGLLVRAHEAWRKKPSPELTTFLEDLEHFMPIFHDRSAPLKLMFEHLALSMPKF